MEQITKKQIDEVKEFERIVKDYNLKKLYGNNDLKINFVVFVIKQIEQSDNFFNYKRDKFIREKKDYLRILATEKIDWNLFDDIYMILDGEVDSKKRKIAKLVEEKEELEDFTQNKMQDFARLFLEE